jgi:hypothetical protein
MTRAEILPQIFQLDEGDQLLIAEAIRNHLEGRQPIVDEAEFKSELERRIADARAHPEHDLAMSDVIRELRARL